MRFLYDNHNVTFIPENEEDQRLLVGFANLDRVFLSIKKDHASLARHVQFTNDYNGSVLDAIEHLEDVVGVDSAFDKPPEDEEDDDFPNDVPLIGGFNI